MTRQVRFLPFLTALLFSLVLLAAETTVYLTKTGEKYHSGSCRYLSKIRTPMSPVEPVKAGYDPPAVAPRR